MVEMVLNTSALPESLVRLIHTERVRVRETHGEILLTPIKESDVDCPLLGMFSDGRISVDKFIANKRIEKELDI
ncbi:MAG: hypothetical protein FWH52_07885 [Synergistaceae bacterium]|nr:hypothetical protein [Synergistaceae bacterium]